MRILRKCVLFQDYVTAPHYIVTARHTVERRRRGYEKQVLGPSSAASKRSIYWGLLAVVSARYNRGSDAAWSRVRVEGQQAEAHAVLRYFTTVAGFFVCANCSSSSPLRTAVISMSMTKGILSSDGMAIAFLPFSNSIGFEPNRTKNT